jgi:hypothetical protein
MGVLVNLQCSCVSHVPPQQGVLLIERVCVFDQCKNLKALHISGTPNFFSSSEAVTDDIQKTSGFVLIFSSAFFKLLKLVQVLCFVLEVSRNSG